MKVKRPEAKTKTLLRKCPCCKTGISYGKPTYACKLMFMGKGFSVPKNQKHQGIAPEENPSGNQVTKLGSVAQILGAAHPKKP